MAPDDDDESTYNKHLFDFSYERINQCVQYWMDDFAFARRLLPPHSPFSPKESSKLSRNTNIVVFSHGPHLSRGFGLTLLLTYYMGDNYSI